MRKLITTPLALQYNMLGMKGKYSFSALKHMTTAVFGKENVSLEVLAQILVCKDTE